MRIVQFIGTSVLAASLIQPSFADDVKTRFTDNELVKILQEEGYQAQIVNKGELEFKSDGMIITLLNLDDGDLQIYFDVINSAITSKAEQYKTMNQWNAQHRLSRAYVNDNGNWFLEDDLLVSGGVTEKTVQSFVNTFVQTSVPIYRWHLLEAREKAARKGKKK